MQHGLEMATFRILKEEINFMQTSLAHYATRFSMENLRRISMILEE